jgi:hypothetical protein
VPVRFGDRFATAETNGDRVMLFGISADLKSEFEWTG